jgi:5-methyltetrahydrofolate--homocysteine methyltransferase
MDTVLKGTGKKVVVSSERPTAIIGERINPTGKKRLAAALNAGELGIIKDEATSQVEVGAHILDVNVGAAGVDEVDLLPKAVRLVLETAEVPLCIDSPNAEALDAALAAHQELNPDGRPLVNSVNGEEASLARVLPLVAKYGTAVIGLCMDDDGIPETPEARLSVARKIVERAESLGIGRDSLIIDTLALTMGADSKAGLITLETIRMVREELGVNIVLGASNASFGLPDRDTINAAFFAMAVQAGATALIMDPAKMGQYVLAADLVMGRDEYAMNYIRAYRRRSK